jgi:hypothetical protein
MALSRTLLYRIVTGVTPSSFSRATHARTCSGKISIIRIGPNSGIRCLQIEYV